MSIKRLGRQKGNDYPAGLNLAKYGSYEVTKSLRFRAANSAYLSRTPGSAGNRRTFTISSWVKRGSLGAADAGLFTAWDGTNRFYSRFEADDKLNVYVYTGGTAYDIATSMVFRDPAAWYHIVLTVDTTQATDTNRIKVYVNGVQQTLTGTYAPQNTDTQWNYTVQQNIGKKDTSGSYFDGHMTEVYSIDGQALTPSSFGATDPITGQWQPVAYSGSYGTNGFYLPFTDTTSTFTLGNDAGNGNNWTTNNFSLTAGATYDSMTDVPTLTSANAANYCTLNPLHNAGTLSNGNLAWSGSNQATHGTIASYAGKYYFEVKLDTYSTGNAYIGISEDAWKGVNGDWPWDQVFAYVTNGNAGGNGSSSAYGATYTQGDTIGVAFDITGNTITFYKNGTSQGVAFTTGLLGKNWRPFVYISASSAFTANFGQRAFSYTPPTGYVALNTYNLPDPAIKVGNKYFDATLYTGTGAARAITNAGGFQPDLVWAKVRSTTGTHVLTDSVRGGNKQIFTNLTTVEASATNKISGFTTTGFTLAADDGSNTGDVNYNGSTYVAWQWKAGGTAVTNTDGILTSQVSANRTAGFSIATYTGSDEVGSFGHGLGVAPALIIIKQRDATGSWTVGVNSPTVGWTWNTDYLFLNSSAAKASDGGGTLFWSAPTSTVVNIGGGSYTSTTGKNLVAYCWAPVAGYSSFGSYAGNSSTDGTFVYTGFKPKFIMVKEYTSTGGSWHMFDSVRNTYNVVNNYIYADSNAAEATDSAYLVDFVSNGFKFKGAGGGINYSGRTYIYAAFAEVPFKNGNAAIYNIN